MTKRKHPPKPRQPGDYDPELIRLYKRFTRYTVDRDGNEADDGKWVMLPVSMRDDILAALERAPRSGPGNPPRSGWDKSMAEWTVALARRHKQELEAGGKPPGEAKVRAAKEYSKRSKHSPEYFIDQIPRRPKRP